MRIDAHQHFWQLGRFDYSWLDAEPLAPIRRDFGPAELRPLLDAAGVDRCVLVQTLHSYEETRWALRLAEEHDWIAGVVGWVDLTAADCEARLLELKSHPRFVGVRHLTQDEPDDAFLLRPEVLRGLEILQNHKIPFELLLRVGQLQHVAALAERLPALKMVIDHLAKPRIREGLIDDWRGDLEAAARHPNVYCKLSGLITEADWQNWSAAELRPYVQAALSSFWPRRCMFGSDWPVCLLAGSYERMLAAMEEAMGSLSEADTAAIFGETAAGFYSLPITV